MPKHTKAEVEEAIETLRELLPPGSTVYTILKTVARSGMSRNISLYTIKNNEPRWLSSLVAKALGCGFSDKDEAVRVGGAGMDMGFHLVNSLSYKLHGHENVNADEKKWYEDPTPESYRSGYSLIHKWM